MIIMKLIINQRECTACGLCKRVCIRNNIEVNDFAEEVGTDYCFECGHCMAVCPNGLISLKKFNNQKDRIEEYNPKSLPVSYEDMLQFFKQRRSCRWFKNKKIDKNTFEKLFEAAYYSPSGENMQKTEFVVIDEKLDEFISLVYDIIKVKSEEYPRIKQLGEYLENKDNFKAHPLLWEGKQIILSFAENTSDALIAATRMELLAYTMKLGGFYSLFIGSSDKIDHDKLMKFFPEIDNEKHMCSAFVIGYPRVRFNRTIPHNKVNVFYK